ncbi:MAG: elongation factor G [Chloroflexi bacterium]|nr:elongation factor G [Chloroflexota bacterium]
MKTYPSENIRNVGFFGHGSSGKTTLVEAMLFAAGLIDRLGRVDDGNTVSDYDPDEQKRGISIYSSLAPCEWKNHKLNLLDSPGFLDFVGEMLEVLRVCECGVICAPANAGIEVGLVKIWDRAEEIGLPCIFYISKMDKENANFDKLLGELENEFSSHIIPLCLPIGKEAGFNGVVDVVAGCAYTFKNGKAEKIDIPADLADAAADYRSRLLESAAESNEELMNKYFETEDLPENEFRQGLRQAIAERRIFPAIPGSSSTLVGTSVLMDILVNYTPSPVDKGEVTGVNPKNDEPVTRKTSSTEKVSAFVFKTTADPYVGKLSFMKVMTGTLRPDSVLYNVRSEADEKITSLFTMRGKTQENLLDAPCGDIAVVSKLQETTTGDTLCDKSELIKYPPIEFPAPVLSMAAFPKTKADEDKLSGAMGKLGDEDPTLKITRDAETKETIMSGLGDLHLEVIIGRMKRKFGVDVDLATPKVPYKETIRAKIQSEYKHKKQSGGRGQYGHVYLELSPRAKGEGFEFEEKIVGGVIPRNYFSSVEKGIIKSMEEGPLAGYPVVDIKAALYDGSFHTVDSSDIAFQIAGSMALKKGVAEANPVLLEPIMDVEVLIPESFMGDVIGDLNGKRGRIMGMEPQPKSHQLLKAQAPLAEMQKYAIDLRSMTQGRGTFKMKFSHYEDVPANIQENIVAAAKRDKEE